MRANADCHEQGIPATSHESQVTNYFSQLKDIFGNRLYIEVQHLSPGDGRTLREAERLGRELGVPLVATNNVHFLQPEEHLHHRAVNAIRTGGLLTTVAPPEITTGEAWFKPAAEMQKCFPDHPELLQATLEIADRCNLQLELGKLIFPEFSVPEGETADSHLRKLCFAGAQRRYQPPGPEVFSRLKRELQVIKKWKLAPYFLLVWDIVEEARRRGIPAVARGSAASSMVTYCLGISRVCPLRWGLYFERFLNEQRGDCPDIDIDICGARRDELLDYVYTRWGEEHVAMIGSFITMHARLAVREVAKVFGVPPGEVDRFTKRLPHRPVREILQAIRGLPECRDLPVDDEPWKTILQVALRLDDAPRHLGIHPCGTVISARPLTRLTPLERDERHRRHAI
jgi:DNA polymerase III alpha subunit